MDMFFTYVYKNYKKIERIFFYSYESHDHKRMLIAIFFMNHSVYTMQ